MTNNPESGAQMSWQVETNYNFVIPRSLSNQFLRADFQRKEGSQPHHTIAAISSTLDASIRYLHWRSSLFLPPNYLIFLEIEKKGVTGSERDTRWERTTDWDGRERYHPHPLTVSPLTSKRALEWEKRVVCHEFRCKSCLRRESEFWYNPDFSHEVQTHAPRMWVVEAKCLEYPPAQCFVKKVQLCLPP